MWLPCPFCKVTFKSKTGLSSHLMSNALCQHLLVGEIPPIPSHFHPVLPSTYVDEVASSHQSNRNRLSSDQPEFNNFPDNLSQIQDHLSLIQTSPADCCFPPHNIFQLPSKLIEKVKQLQLTLDDSDSCSLSDGDSHNLCLQVMDSSILPPPQCQTILLQFPPATLKVLTVLPLSATFLKMCFTLPPTKTLTCFKPFLVPLSQ